MRVSFFLPLLLTLPLAALPMSPVELRSYLQDFDQEVKRQKLDLELVQEQLSLVEEKIGKSSNQALDQARLGTLEKRLSRLESDLQSLQKTLDKEMAFLRKQLKSMVDLLDEDDETIYTVVYGDSLGSIAAKFKTSVSQLKQANDLTSDRIFSGQELRIP